MTPEEAKMARREKEKKQAEERRQLLKRKLKV